MSFARERLIDWRKGAWIAALIVAGNIVGSFAATQSSDAILDAIVIAGLLLVLGMLLMRPDRWLVGKEGGRCQFLRTPATDQSALEDASVDVVTTRSVLIYASDKRRAFEEFFRVLKPGGRLSIFEPVAIFREPEPPGLFMGCDVSPVAHLAERIKAVYERAQPRDSHPMFDFDERDLFGFAEEAGFGEVHLDYEARVAWGNPPEWGDKAWTILARTAPNPQVPSLVEAVEAALDSEEAERFLGYLKPLVEGGRRKRREARAYLWAVKGA